MAKEDRGFASMDRAKQREIASKGGKAAHQKGTAHEWTSEEARDAGRKGGLASHKRRREQMLGRDQSRAVPTEDGDTADRGDEIENRRSEPSRANSDRRRRTRKMPSGRRQASLRSLFCRSKPRERQSAHRQEGLI